MKITEIKIKKTMIELSDEEKEILLKAGRVLDSLYEADRWNYILCDILEETVRELTDFDDISFVLKRLCEEGSFCVSAKGN